MSFYDSTDAVYGIARYGSASYGVVQPTVSLTGVGATANTRTIHLNVFEVDITEPLYNAQPATGSVGSLTLHTTAGLVGVSADGLVNTVSENIDEPIGSVSAVASLGSIRTHTTEVLDSVSATLTIDTAGLLVKSFNYIAVTLPAATGSIGTVEAKTLEALESVSATTAVNGVTVHLVEKLTGVVATGFIGSLEHSNTLTLTGVVGTGEVGQVGGGPSEEIATGVEATGYVNGVTVHVLEALEAATSTGDVGTITVTTTKFDFEAVKHLYSHRRAVIVPRAA